jgi:DNA polymerase I-like protein with 3'-5' exonuclease and polymerase domains
VTAATHQSNGTFPADARPAASYYLSRGVLPIPVGFRTKKPTEKAWERLRPVEADLDTLFPAGTRLNIGLLLGEPSRGLVDVDLDCPQALAAAPLLLPPTHWVSGRKTSPRSHHWYRVSTPPAKAETKWLDLDRSLLLELRSTGAHTVAPPSRHQDTGEAIEWDAFGEPAEVSIADLMRACQSLAAAALLSSRWPAAGSRQDAALALAGGLLRGGLAQEQAERLVSATALAAGDEEHGKRAAAVGSTARTLAEGGQVTGWPRLAELLGPSGGAVVHRVREWLGLAVLHSAPKPGPSFRIPEPYLPFPTETLPEPLASFVAQGAAALGCDPAYIALPALTVVASLIGNTRAIRLKRDWVEPCVIWSGIVGDSGTLKSPGMKKASGCLFRLQKQLIHQFKQDLQVFQRAKADHDRRTREGRKHAVGGTLEDLGPPPEEPLLRRIVCSDTTIEKLADILQDNPRGTLLWRDELGGWINSFQRYKGKAGGSDLPGWLEMFRGETLIIDRKTTDRRTLFVPRAAVSVAGGIQPGTLARALTPEYLEAGLGARLLLAWPLKIPKRWSETEIHPDVEAAYGRLFQQLLALDFERDAEGEQMPFVVWLTPNAKAAWIRFYNQWAEEQAAAEGELAAALSKLEAYAARLALVHHVVSQVSAGGDGKRPIEAVSIDQAVILVRWFAYEARRIYASLAESAQERLARKLLEFVRSQGGRVTPRRLQRSNPGRYKTADTAEEALETLVQAGLAEWRDVGPTAPGGRPTRILILKPNLTPDKTDKTPPGAESDPPPPPDRPPDTTPDNTPHPVKNPRVSEGFVSFVRCQVEKGVPSAPVDVVEEADRGLCQAQEVLSGRPERNSSPLGGPGDPHPCTVQAYAINAINAVSLPSYRLVNEPAEVPQVLQAIDGSAVVCVDCETSGLDPRTDRIRLLTLRTDTVDGGRFTYLVDCFQIDPRPLFELLAERPLVGHNLVFDLQFLMRLGFEPGPVRDTMLLSQLLHAGEATAKHTLADCALRDLGRDLDKTHQTADWSRPLTAEMLAYAALDVDTTLDLYLVLVDQIRAASLGRVADIEHRALPCVAWMSLAGAPFDRGSWSVLAQEAAAEAEDLGDKLDATATQDPTKLFTERNWNSNDQVKRALALAGCEVAATSDAVLASLDHPLAEVIRLYRAARKRATTYGAAWLRHVTPDGRVYAKWWQASTAAGRMSCSKPNLQQIPQDVRYRRCVAAPPGRLLVRADYSQIELRIAALISEDKAMLDAYRSGIDLHVSTAQRMLGKQDVSKAERQIAKSANFGLLYGLGARGYRAYAQAHFGLRLSEDQARHYRKAFFDAYPGLAAWHRQTGRTGEQAIETRTLAGRRRLGVQRFTEKLNSPVQGSGADGLKQALGLLWERRHDCPGAFPVIACHDEIVIECDADQAEAVASWLKHAMLDGMAPLIEPVPVEVEVKVGRTWGGE